MKVQTSILLFLASFSTKIVVSQASDSCNICGDGNQVGDQDSCFYLEDDPFPYSCAAASFLAGAGLFDNETCRAIPSVVYDACDCEPAGSNDAGSTRGKKGVGKKGGSTGKKGSCYAPEDIVDMIFDGSEAELFALAAKGRQGYNANDAASERQNLGMGFDMKRQNLGALQLTPGSRALDIAEACLRSDSSAATIDTTFVFASDLKEFTSKSSNSFSFDASVPIPTQMGIVSASFGSTYGSSESITSMSENRYAALTYRSRTSDVTVLSSPDCLKFNPNIDNVLKAFESESLPYDNPRWVTFFKAFGTHVAMRSSNGGAISLYARSAARSRCKESEMKSSLCASLKLSVTDTGPGANTCNNIDDQTKSCTSSDGYSEECFALGAAASGGAASGACSQWSGSTNSTASAISYQFQALHELLRNAALPNACPFCDVIEKATNLYYCNDPFVWNPTAQTCECQKTCKNEGVGPDAYCNCACCGNKQHGFTGPECEEEYGYCTAGRDSYWDMGNLCRDTAGDCNYLGYHVKPRCRRTEQCCASDWNVRCCPLTTSCVCSTFGCSCSAHNPFYCTPLQNPRNVITPDLVG